MHEDPRLDLYHLYTNWKLQHWYYQHTTLNETKLIGVTNYAGQTESESLSDPEVFCCFLVIGRRQVYVNFQKIDIPISATVVNTNNRQS